MVVSDRGNRTPGCRVRDGDVSHYTISDVVGGISYYWPHKPVKDRTHDTVLFLTLLV